MRKQGVANPTITSKPDFLTVTLSLKSQTERPAAEADGRAGAVEVVTDNRATVFTLLDTGSLAGNFLSDTVVKILKAEPYIYTSKSKLSVCSGLDNT